MLKFLRSIVPRAVLLSVVGAAVCPLMAALPDLDFTTTAEVSGWEATHDVGMLSRVPEGLVIPITGTDPFITSPPFSLSATNDLMVEIRLKSETGGPGQLFWYRDGAREEASVHFIALTNAWTDLCLALPPGGEGSRLRLDPPGTRGTAHLAWIRVSPFGRRGITRITASGQRLEMAAAGVSGDCEVIELEPQETFSDTKPWMMVHHVTLQGRGVFSVPRRIAQTERGRDRLTSGFFLREKHPVFGRRPCGPIRHVEVFEETAALKTLPVKARGKKGLQVQMVDDALALDIKHAALNVDLPSLFDPALSHDSYVWFSNGVEFRFRKSAVDAIPVKPLSDAGVSVSLILLAYASGKPDRDALWLHPGYSAQAPNRLGSFNISTREGMASYLATIEFLSDRFSQPDGRNGRISHFIVGNEVTAHWHWANMGDVPSDIFVADYLRTVRLTQAASRKVTDAIRVCLSLDHHWNITYGNQPTRAIPGRRLIDDFNRQARMGGNFDWHLAYHPYPENLFKADTWKDKTATGGPETPRITFRNLDVLTAYLRRPELLLKGEPRRILLSEQGFHSDGTQAGEDLQAAAYAYAWQKIESEPGIDAFILHRHVDHSHEGGLNLGLWRRKPDSVADPLSKKPIYGVFQAADTPRREEAFRFALPIIGITNWSELPGGTGGPPVKRP